MDYNLVNIIILLDMTVHIHVLTAVQWLHVNKLIGC